MHFVIMLNLLLFSAFQVPYIFFLPDLKLHLQSTDYGSFLQNEAGPLSVSVIEDRLREKMVTEFRHLRNQAVEPLATFMDYVTYALCFFINIDIVEIYCDSLFSYPKESIGTRLYSNKKIIGKSQ